MENIGYQKHGGCSSRNGKSPCSRTRVLGSAVKKGAEKFRPTGMISFLIVDRTKECS